MSVFEHPLKVKLKKSVLRLECDFHLIQATQQNKKMKNNNNTTEKNET